VFEVEVVDVDGLQFVHDEELVDTLELGDQLTAEQRLHTGHQAVGCSGHAQLPVT